MAGAFFQKSDDFTGASNGATVNVDQSMDGTFSLSVNETGGAATSWTVVLEGSLDGTNWTTIITHARTDGVGVMKWPADAIRRPVRFLRSRCSAVVLGAATKITATFLAA